MPNVNFSDAHVGKAQSLMLDIMSGLVNETNCMDNDLLELIYQHILPPFKHQMPAAYLLASDLLRLTANTIEPHVLNVRKNQTDLSLYSANVSHLFISKYPV